MGERQALVRAAIILRNTLFLRGEKILLDRDLEELYGVETRILKQAVRRNRKRFPKTSCMSLLNRNLKIGDHNL